MEEKLYNKLDEYYDKFGDVFPTMQYSFSREETIQKIDQCIKENKKIQEIIPLKENVIY
jgi:hypothetical protein